MRFNSLSLVRGCNRGSDRSRPQISDFCAASNFCPQFALTTRPMPASLKTLHFPACHAQARFQVTSFAQTHKPRPKAGSCVEAEKRETKAREAHQSAGSVRPQHQRHGQGALCVVWIQNKGLLIFRRAIMTLLLA